MSPSEIAAQYDFIVCGSGSAGSVVARRLAENPEISVLLLEAGGTDDVPDVMDPGQWMANFGSERDWGFVAQPIRHLNGRSLALSMGKVLGGGSSINAMVWARGHQNDWDYFAAEAGDKAWSYEAVLEIYRRIEDWHGTPDRHHRGMGGPAFVEPAPNPHPLARAVVNGAAAIGIPSYRSNNGPMMEGPGGAAILDIRVRGGRRQSAFRAYVAPYLERPNLTVLTNALVTKLTLEGNRVTGVEFRHDRKAGRVRAGSEVIVSLGALHTPKLLMQSGIGDAEQLSTFGIPVTQHLPGVGQNYQDHVVVPCTWECREPITPRNNGGEATFFWKSVHALETPDLQVGLAEFEFANPDAVANYSENVWMMCACVVRPKSRGRVCLTGPDPLDPLRIESNLLADPDDMKAAIACVELCREVAASAPMVPFVKRAVSPGDLKGDDLEQYVRDSAGSFWHQTCTAKMGRDEMSVVDNNLKVYGIDRLRIADGSIMPRVTTGAPMAPCMVIGERASEILKAEHRL